MNRIIEFFVNTFAYCADVFFDFCYNVMNYFFPEPEIEEVVPELVLYRMKLRPDLEAKLPHNSVFKDADSLDPPEAMQEVPEGLVEETLKEGESAIEIDVIRRCKPSDEIAKKYLVGTEVVQVSEEPCLLAKKYLGVDVEVTEKD